ncbi:hypothetical protein MNB_SUP05-SYMBIONT-4-642 [hydrothermal vent metagenome]|uniref:Uncharacterized protein n=1 Tax=hydrothermal vent metagenome TaxID=652676 RepID=A0A1W1DZ92_9ZZZZ
MIDKKAVVDRIFKQYMGAYDFICGDRFTNKTVPILKKLEKNSKTADELIDSFLNSKISEVSVTFTDTGEKWNPCDESLIVFLSDRTHWDFWAEGFNDYLVRTEGNNNNQSSVLFELRDPLSQTEKSDIRQWILAK